MTQVKTVGTKNRIGILMASAIAAFVLTLNSQTARAEECTSDGAYSETCIFNKNFSLEKKVRVKDSNDDGWEDKIVDVPEGRIIEFRIKVKNTGEVDVDDMKMEDILPDELEKTGGDGLTEYWENFDVDETKTFIIEARIRSTEFDRTDNFENCVVNKAKVFYSDDLEGSDTATVCYGESKITELPKAGATATEIMSIVGFASTGVGIFINRKFR